jgi:hypothetical protein
MDRALFLLLLLVPAKNVEVVGESGQTACRQFFLRCFSRASPRACLPACAQVENPQGKKKHERSQPDDFHSLEFAKWLLPNRCRISSEFPIF